MRDAAPQNTPPPLPSGDALTRFLLDHAGVRGVHVRLADTWREIRAREDYPDAVAGLLGEATAAAALFTGHAKVDGRLSVQLRGEGALRTLFAECTAAGTLRAIAQFDTSRGTVPTGLDDLRENAVLAITIENPATHAREPARYQGLVELSAGSLADVFEGYFVRSEQLPTRLMLASDGGTACGLMLQALPGDRGDDDGWRRACALFDTLTRDELLALAPDDVVRRLFHEERPEIFPARPLRFGCSCSRERVASMLQSLGEDEARAAVIDGRAEVRCEFCGKRHHFLSADLDLLFTPEHAPMPAPGHTH